MCWVGKNACKIAERDIVVYKMGSISENIFISLYKNYIYKKGKINKDIVLVPDIRYEVNGVFRIEDPLYAIYRGYHSYTSISMSYSDLGLDSRTIYLGKLPYILLLRNYCYIATFIIPKGSNYFENDRGEIVSSNIIYTGKYIKL